jgi:hypothetical protein
MPHHQRPITAEDGTADVVEVEYGLRRAGMCTRFLPMAGPSRQPAKKTCADDALLTACLSTAALSMKSLLQYCCHRLTLESPENRLEDPIGSQAIASRQPGLLAGVLGPKAKMKEPPLVRHRSDFLLLLGLLKRSRAKFLKHIMRSISERSCFISPIA